MICQGGVLVRYNGLTRTKIGVYHTEAEVIEPPKPRQELKQNEIVCVVGSGYVGLPMAELSSSSRFLSFEFEIWESSDKPRTKNI